MRIDLRRGSTAWSPYSKLYITFHHSCLGHRISQVFSRERLPNSIYFIGWNGSARTLRQLCAAARSPCRSCGGRARSFYAHGGSLPPPTAAVLSRPRAHHYQPHVEADVCMAHERPEVADECRHDVHNIPLCAVKSTDRSEMQL